MLALLYRASTSGVVASPLSEKNADIAIIGKIIIGQLYFNLLLS